MKNQFELKEKEKSDIQSKFEQLQIEITSAKKENAQQQDLIKAD